MPYKNKSDRKKYITTWNKKNRKKIVGYSKRYYSQPHIKIRHENQRLNKELGINLSQKEQMITSQNNCCAICGRRFLNNKDCHVDHNHLTKKIREILCVNCNNGLGQFQDNTYLLEKAVLYLKKWS